MHGRALTFTVACLLLVCAALLYLEWWRAGEMELLNGRVSELEDARQRRAKRSSSTGSKAEVASD